MTINQYFRQRHIFSLLPKVKTDYGRMLRDITTNTLDPMWYDYSLMSCSVWNPDDNYEFEKPNGYLERRTRTFNIFYAHNYYNDAGAYVMRDNKNNIWIMLNLVIIFCFIIYFVYLINSSSLIGVAWKLFSNLLSLTFISSL